MNELIKVEVNNNNLVVSSLEIATNFQKQHDNVLRDIENLKDVLNFGEMFIKDSYLDSYGRKQKQYLLNENGDIRSIPPRGLNARYRTIPRVTLEEDLRNLVAKYA